MHIFENKGPCSETTEILLLCWMGVCGYAQGCELQLDMLTHSERIQRMVCGGNWPLPEWKLLVETARKEAVYSVRVREEVMLQGRTGQREQQDRLGFGKGGDSLAAQSSPVQFPHLVHLLCSCRWAFICLF